MSQPLTVSSLVSALALVGLCLAARISDTPEAPSRTSAPISAIEAKVTLQG